MPDACPPACRQASAKICKTCCSMKAMPEAARTAAVNSLDLAATQVAAANMPQQDFQIATGTDGMPH